MLKDWNFWCSIITAGVALCALLISCQQMALSNKQCLFERRLKAYMLVQGMIDLCREYLDSILAERNNGPEPSVDSMFANLTNNSYLESMANAIEHPLQSPFHQDLLRRREELRKMAMECELIFKGKETLAYSEFVRAYEKTLEVMYRYKMVIDKMEETNNKHHMTEEVLINICGEKPARHKLYDALEALKTAYEAAVQKNVQRKVRKQITLKSWFM
ncbi:MAG: hypothetical protein UF438_08430 [Oribacterium sp.]|nr:hypothetical protein [Oribacterium sp.]